MQKTLRTRFRAILLDEALIERTQGAQTHTTADATASKQEHLLRPTGLAADQPRIEQRPLRMEVRLRLSEREGGVRS